MKEKQQFLLEHNKLSPLDLQATTFLLSRFKEEKAALFKDDSWSIDKLRRPFILWLTSLTVEEKKDIKKKENMKNSHNSNKNRNKTRHRSFVKKHRTKK